MLKEHFETGAKNATYRSKTVQNKVIHIYGKQIVESIKGEIIENRFYSILADEASDCSKKEQLALVIRYIDRQNDVTERFLGFVHCDEGLSGDDLTKKIIEAVKTIGLPLKDCRGRGYDGAAAMSSLRKGVAGNILKKVSKAFYVHCASHRLNLCVASSCKLGPVSRVIDQTKCIANFFNNSPLRASFLSQKLRDKSVRKTKIDNPSLTRWIARISSLDGIVESHHIIVDALEIMKFNMERKWSSPTPAEAEALLNVCTSFEFIAVLIITTVLLDCTMPLTQRLQERKIDV